MSIIWSPSPNHSPGPRTVRGIVIHDTEGGLQGSLRTLTAPGGASAHYVIAFDGTTYQLVSEDDVAYHVAAFGANPVLNRNRPAWLGAYNGLYSAVNAVSVGIELVGYASQGYTSDQYQVLGELIGEICARWSLSLTCLPDAGADATIVTHGWLQTDRSDPGPLFDWDVVRGFLEMNDAERQNLLDRIAALEADQTQCNAIKQQFEAWLRAREGRRVKVPAGLADQLIAAAGAP